MQSSLTHAAIIDGTRRVTHRELHERAVQLAHVLADRGVARGTMVGIALERSVDAIVAMLAVWKLGAAYVPIDPRLPASRIAAMLAASQADHILATSRARDRVPAESDVILIDAEAATIAAAPVVIDEVADQAEDVAYVMFTSGTTGAPKGVAVTHHNLAHYTRAISTTLADLRADASDDALSALGGWSFAMVSTFAADLGYTALLPALAAGATLHLLDDATTTEPARFAEYMSEHHVDVLKITPSHLRALVGDATGESLAARLPARWLILGGEPLSFGFAERLTRAHRCRVLNHYGPTETTVGACTLEVTEESVATARAAGALTVPIGTALPGVHLAIVDGAGAATSDGVEGELHVGGAGVARGYVNAPALTTERFVDVQGLGRAYRTGDRVRRLPNGVLEFLGRHDDQVKVRGYRVELGEIEHVLRAHPGVADAVVLVSQGDDSRLLACVVPSSAAASAERVVREQELTDALATRLPSYMLPDQIVFLSALPLTPNGKIDRAAVRREALDGSRAAAANKLTPRTETERILEQIWSEALRVERVGVTDRFLEIGGHSLVAIRILGKISRTFGVRIPLRTMFEGATVAGLAQAVDSARVGGIVQ